MCVCSIVRVLCYCLLFVVGCWLLAAVAVFVAHDVAVAAAVAVAFAFAFLLLLLLLPLFRLYELLIVFFFFCA